jgi:hypothetical protein
LLIEIYYNLLTYFLFYEPSTQTLSFKSTPSHIKLPRDFHGPVKNYLTPTDIYAEKQTGKTESHFSYNKISNWKRKITDKDVIGERKEFLVHPAYKA